MTISANTGSGLSLLGTYNLSDPGVTNPFVADLINVSSFNLANVSQVTVKINNAKLDTFNTRTSGLSEVAFQTIPEPSTTALLGLVGLGAILRRRR